MFSQQAEQELLETMKAFDACKQQEGKFVSSYVLKIKGYIDNLECLGHPMSLQLAMSLILPLCLRSMNDSCKTTICVTWGRLHVMLKLHEKGLPKKVATHVVLAINARRIHKHNNNNKKPQAAA
ncbi:hypothetical protein CTI12_AA005150 [Artemisia annua]|uniref:Zinc finger, CCHC-type n=1 Tax=Artemisia annua TaxID=35608 RepID=A0A2U1QNQ0_ARTAN|nr:hypothetical protein CTI12_AA005150 [Artemisia annua]